MELYTLDNNFLKEDVIDEYTSVIWTERYNQFGDVSLTLPATDANAERISEGTFLHTPVSKEVMLIDTILVEDGVLTAKGQTLVGFLVNRLFRNTWATTVDSWTLTGVPGVLAGDIVEEMCLVGGAMDAGNVIPDYGPNEVIPKLSIGPLAAGAVKKVALQYGNVYDAVKIVCDLGQVGFSMYPPNILDGTGNMIFTTYKGLNRTSGQSTNDIVIFEPAMDTLAKISVLRSKAGYATAAYAWGSNMPSKASVGRAFAPGTDLATGFNRRSLMVSVSDVSGSDHAPADLVDILNNKAEDALANNNYVRLADGTIVPQSQYQYGTHYNLGDVIELRGDSAFTQSVRVTEYIRSHDSSGESAYPTLSVID